MHLERLEIAGFKSFSDRSQLAFDRGVTAIVGPNGCGKSNVADALTWVLGEQSAKSLRGDKMEDVIFSGSDARKPTGAAEVSLRLSNVIVPPSLLKELGHESSGPSTAPGAGHEAAPAHGSMPRGSNGNGNGNGNGHGLAQLLAAETATRDVEVTRRLFRSGESEYLIDGQICRLRDIHELLMDTGLGAKAYAIIEQGKIGMILSSRPTDRRQLIEEAAGITKYKARRRAAELKLEAAQQNLTRLDDIVFEVDKQRGSMKRQAAKARRYARLRDEMRRWEKVLLARRYQGLADTIESARGRLDQARANEAAAAARLAEVESDLSRLRLEMTAADEAATRTRDAVHAHELEINRRQQQIALDTQQGGMLQVRAEELAVERENLESRREPELAALAGRRQAVIEAEAARDEAASRASAAADEYARAQHAIDALEQDVEQARADVYAVLNTITAINAAHESASSQRERAVDVAGRLDLESREVTAELHRMSEHLRATADSLKRAQDGLDAARIARAARESELASARIEHEWRERDVRSREQELTAATARLRSLEEIDTHRSGFADAARLVLVSANGRVGQMGALADFIEVEPRYERAVEACLGELLQHVLVERLDHVTAGLQLIRKEDAGRCGFVIGRPAIAEATTAVHHDVPAGVVPLESVVRVGGPFPAAVQAVLRGPLVAESFDTAARIAPLVPFPVVTLEGDVFRGGHVVTGGDKAESRGILAGKREIKELRERINGLRAGLDELASETARFELMIAHATAAIDGLSAELHRQEKAIVGIEAQATRAAEDEFRLQQRLNMVTTELVRAREEIAALDARQSEGMESIARLDEQKVVADGGLSESQRRLFEARETAEGLSLAAAEAKAAHAALIERSVSARSEVTRMDAAALELEERLAACSRDAALMRDQRERLLLAVGDAQRLLDDDVRGLEGRRAELQAADDWATELKAATESQEEVIRDARRAVDSLRALVAEVDVMRVMAESDLAHLAQHSLDSVGATLDEIRAQVAEMEAAGQIEPDVRAIRAAEAPDADEEEEAGSVSASADEPPPAHMTAEEAIAELRGKIDRIGPVNMMAIDQFTELEGRHGFLTTQRQDLIDSISETNQAISRIDETTHARFREAFTAINTNFQQTFSTLFGGGRAGITLLDDADPLESGIDIVASPPGKRLQNVMLLSGGEKALTAIALMFAIFRYKPSPFCLLDEIDAPLDDANIGRFVEMLRSMMDRTQFIIITHNRKTMEIANRLYGVTMEESGVSKLISIQLH
jgi:chromosome segregation protein